MADQQRRRAPGTAARLALLLAANAACALFLWYALTADRGASAHAPADEHALADDHALAHAVARADVPEPSPTRRALANDRDAQLTARIQARVDAAREKARSETKGKVQPGEVTIAVHVRELAVPGDVVAIAADRSLRPASNMKLVTTAAALVLLGPDWNFETKFTSAAPVENGHLRGDLVVRAGGDPLYDPAAAGEVDALLAPALDALVRAGIRAVDGALVLDENGFQPPEPGPSWPSGDRWKEYCALAGGFSANAGCLTATVRTQGGGAAAVDVRPEFHGFPRKLAVRTVGAKQSLDVRVGALTGTVIVEGSIPSDVPAWEARFAVPDPVDLFGRVLGGALRARGIDVRGALVRERREPVAGERELARVATPLANVLEPINTHSNNACADQLFLALGHAQSGRGTREGGRAATASALQRLGLDAESLVQVDGSGLSRENRVSARQITALLDAVVAQGSRTARLYFDSLAVGHESGTLDGRMKSEALAGRVHAKTGFINGTSALSGFIDAHDGRTFAFSILVEYPPSGGLNQSVWKPMQDAICADIAGVGE